MGVPTFTQTQLNEHIGTAVTSNDCIVWAVGIESKVIYDLKVTISLSEKESEKLNNTAAVGKIDEGDQKGVKANG